MPQSTTGRAGLWASVALGLVTCVLAASFLVRTRLVVGPRVAGELADWAREHDAELEVGSMRPVGLTGIRLEDVDVTLRRRGVTARLETDAIDVYPSWSELLAGRARPGRLVVQGGGVTVRPAPAAANAAAATSRENPTSDKPAASGDDGHGGPAPADGAAAPQAPPLEVTLRDLAVRAEIPGRLAARPARLDRLNVEITREGGLALGSVAGYGELAGGIPFSAVTDRTGGPASRRRIRFDFDRPTQLTDWLDRTLPAGASVGAAEVCPYCSPRRICLEDLTVRAPKAFEFLTAEACLASGDEGFQFTTPEVEIHRRERALPYRIQTLRADVSTDGSDAPTAASLEVGIISERREKLRATLKWRRADQQVDASLEAERFRLRRPLELAGLDRWVRGGVLNGTVDGKWQTDLQLVSLEGDIGYRDGTIDHSFLDAAPLTIDTGRMSFRGVWDLSDRSLAVESLKLALADSQPVEIWGSLVDTQPHWSFDAHLRADSVNAPNLRDVLPDTLAHPAKGARMQGRFDLQIATSGHTAFPDSLQLSVDVDGDVEVARDSPYADIRSLALTGPPPLELTDTPVPAPPLERWATLSNLPEMVPEVVIAAEDAQFYEHPGFSWRGIRNAMAHNLKVDRLERGGSTITQQLAKNLFLTRRRTLARKFREIWVTWRLEEQLSKDRILELYLNLVQWGPGVQGIEEAARHYFGVPAGELSVAQMTLLGAILPGPTIYGPWLEAGYLPSSRVEKMEHILSNLRFLDIIDSETYQKVYDGARAGEVGGLELTVCEDDKHAPPEAPECPPDV